VLAILTPLLSLLGIEVASITDEVKRKAIVWGIIGALGVVFAAFVLVAINAALSFRFGPVVAPLIIALAAALLAIAVFLVAQMQEGMAARRDAERRKNAESTALVTTALLSALPALLRSPLMREVGIPAGAAIASALLLKRTAPRDRDDRQEP
jgi:cobalamin synthase